MHVSSKALKALLVAGIVASPAFAANPQKVEINVDYNVETEAVNHWVATGAFSDEGTINNNHSSVFKGSSAHVVDTPQGAKGSFTWSLDRSFTTDPKFPGVLKSSGEWKMLSGTGDYVEISGQGTLKGTLNTITGQLHDTFIGNVTLSKK